MRSRRPFGSLTRRLVALIAEKPEPIHEIGSRGEIVGEREGLFEVPLEHASSCRILCTRSEIAVTA